MTIVCTSVNSYFKNALPDHVVITLLLVTLGIRFSKYIQTKTHFNVYAFYPARVFFSVTNKMTQLFLSVIAKE